MEKLIVSRQWKSPSITVKMSAAEIGSEMNMDEYLESLVTQVTNLPFTFTKATLLVKMKEGHTNIVNEMKHSTKYVV
jgi:hypothetical protein